MFNYYFLLSLNKIGCIIIVNGVIEWGKRVLGCNSL